MGIAMREDAADRRGLSRALGRRIADEILTLGHGPRFRLERGPWDPPRQAPSPAHFGYLVCEGLLARQVAVADRRSLELLGPGDVLRPWQENTSSFAETRWSVLERADVLELDGDFVARAGRSPDVVVALTERAIDRSRAMAVQAAIEAVIGLDRRLLLLLWHLAERWGRLDVGGPVIPVRLTHALLADLAGARRPSVTTAVSDLERSGSIRRTDEGHWQLLEPPPAVSEA
jgi:hypothetical protein